MKGLYILIEVFLFLFLSLCLFDMLIVKRWKNKEVNEIIKYITKSKKIRYVIFLVFVLNFASVKFTNIKINSQDYKYRNDLIKKRNYEIIEKENGKLYAVLERAEAVPKAIIAEVKSYNEIILEKPKNTFNPYKGEDIIIDLNNLEMINSEYEFHFVQNFDEVTFENKSFQKIKEKNEVYIYPYVYKIVEEKEDNITIKFKGRKKVKYEEIVPWVNNEQIPSNYLEFYKGEKTLTVVF